MNQVEVNTHADGFGIWHAEVSFSGNAVGSDTQATQLAKKAIRAELRERNSADILKGVTLEHRDSRDGTLTYYFKEA